MESVGFKEWAVVCDALGRGEQSVILRKGGIAEGRAGFSFKHAEFFLFPTFFHEQILKVRTSVTSLPSPANDTVTIRYCAHLERTLTINSLATLEKLAPRHILTAEVVRERFRTPPVGLAVALVRVFALADGWTLPNEKRFGGCRSWVELPPPPPNLSLTPVLEDGAHARRVSEFEGLVSSSTLDQVVSAK